MQVGGEQQLPQEALLPPPPPARRSKTPTAQRSVFPAVAAAAAMPLRTWDALTAEALSQVEHARPVQQQQWDMLKMRRHKQWKYEQYHTKSRPTLTGAYANAGGAAA